MLIITRNGKIVNYIAIYLRYFTLSNSAHIMYNSTGKEERIFFPFWLTLSAIEVRLN